MPAQSTATVNPAGPDVTVQVFDCPNNFGTYTLKLHDAVTGAVLAVLVANANSQAAFPNIYSIPRPANQTAGTAVVCTVTLVPAGVAGPLQFSMRAFQGAQRIDDGLGQVQSNSNLPVNDYIRMAFV